MRLRLALAVPAALFVGLFMFAAAPLAAFDFPSLTGRVVDQAGIIPDAEKTALEDKLAALEEKTTDQLVVATVKSLEGADIADYGYQLGRNWGIGQKGKNNGVLLIVAPNEHAVRFEVGYGLEGDLTDAVTRLIIENSILPRFKAGDMNGGIERGVDDIIQVLTGDAAAFKERAAQRPETSGGGSNAFAIFFVVIVLVIIFSRFGGWWPLLFLAGRGGSSRGSSGWGGSSGGGFSGGGGSFGGGGSSGHW
jgi:uncharacterized protein